MSWRYFDTADLSDRMYLQLFSISFRFSRRLFTAWLPCFSMSVFSKHRSLVAVLTFIFLSAVTAVVILWATGYRPDPENGGFTKTGMVAVKSSPEGAKIYLDGKLVAVTDDSLAGIAPGEHQLKVTKEGYVSWNKTITVYEELVTDVDVLLVPISTRIEPLSNTGAGSPVLSPGRDKIAYFTENGEYPGIWALPLGGQPFVNIFKSNSNIIIENTDKIKFSTGERLWWSPEELEMLVKMNEEGYYLIDLKTGSYTATASAQPIFERWEEHLVTKRQRFIDELDIPEYLKDEALSPETQWSPNETRFLYTREDGDYVEYRVANFEQPLAVGGSRDYVSLRVKRTDPVLVSWYSDNSHLILVTPGVDGSATGTIELIEIDGGNRTEVYSGNMADTVVYPTPSGDKLIFLASFKQNTRPDLYAVVVR